MPGKGADGAVLTGNQGVVASRTSATASPDRSTGGGRPGSGWSSARRDENGAAGRGAADRTEYRPASARETEVGDGKSQISGPWYAVRPHRGTKYGLLVKPFPPPF